MRHKRYKREIEKARVLLKEASLGGKRISLAQVCCAAPCAPAAHRSVLILEWRVSKAQVVVLQGGGEVKMGFGYESRM